MTRVLRWWCLLAALTVPATAALAQQRPLLTEDPEVVGSGRVLVEAGFDLDRDVLYPVSGLRGDRLSLPTLGVSIGLSSIAELQIDGGIFQRLSIVERRPGAPLASLLEIEDDRTTDVEDLVLGVKVKFFGETPSGRPVVGFRMATKLPNASNEAGLGTDMTDFLASLLVAKTVQSIRVVGNAGVAILGNASAVVPEQHDLLTVGLSVARAMTPAAEIVAELNGRINFVDNPDPGGENRGALRLGARYTRGMVRADGGIILGMTPRDPQFGITAGVTWVFDAFTVP